MVVSTDDAREHQFDGMKEEGIRKQLALVLARLFPFLCIHHSGFGFRD